MTNSLTLKQLTEELEKEKEKVNKIATSFSSIPRNSDPVLCAKTLLKAFLNDEPFDRYMFGQQPVKTAFIDEAFTTGDMEIVTTCFGFVEQSMKPAAFYRMIKDTPQYLKIYNLLHKNVGPTLILDKSFYSKENIPKIRDICEKQPKGILKSVIQDHIDKLSDKTIDYGFEKVDSKWAKIKECHKSRNFMSLRPEEILKKDGFFSTKWKSAVDPYQAARMAIQWGAPREIVQKFAQSISKKKDLEQYDFDNWKRLNTGRPY